jgi:hypothetical protein
MRRDQRDASVGIWAGLRDSLSRIALSTHQGHGDRSFRGCQSAVSEGAVKAVATAFAEACWLQTRPPIDKRAMRFDEFRVTEGVGEDDEFLFIVDMNDWPEGEGFGDWFVTLMREHGVEVWD